MKKYGTRHISTIRHRLTDRTDKKIDQSTKTCIRCISCRPIESKIGSLTNNDIKVVKNPPMGDRLGVAVGLMGSENPADSAF